MNRSLFPHIIWVLVASISFIVGYKFFPAGDDRSVVTRELQQEDLSLADGKSLKREGKRVLSQQGKGAGSEIGLGALSEKKILSDLDIESLGQKLKESTNPIDRRLASVTSGTDHGKCLAYQRPDQGLWWRESGV